MSQTKCYEKMEVIVESFIKRSVEKHGARYDYTLSKNDYINNRTPVRIGCKVCGSVFTALPQDHVSKQPHRMGGCPDCLKTSGRLGVGIVIRWSKNIEPRKTAWLEKAEAKHAGKYRYPKLDAEFRNEKSIITVVCGDCGHVFTTPARVHISPHRYSGCVVCNRSAMAEKIKIKNQERQLMNFETKDQPVPTGYIYQITNMINQRSYVGFTTMTLKKRLKAHVDASRQVRKETFKSKSHIHNAIRKYGPEAFTIEPLQTLHNVTPIELASLETTMIQQLKPHYNLTEGGDMWGPSHTTPIPVMWIDPKTGESGTYRSLAHAARSVGGEPRKIKHACLTKKSYLNREWALL